METYSTMTFGDMCIVRPAGEITSRSYRTFEAHLVNGMRAGMRVVFNMESVDFVDSVGIVFLLRVKGVVEACGCRFSMYNLPGRLVKIVKRLSLERELNVEETVEECFAYPFTGWEEKHAAGALAGCAVAERKLQ